MLVLQLGRLFSECLIDHLAGLFEVSFPGVHSLQDASAVVDERLKVWSAFFGLLYGVVRFSFETKHAVFFINAKLLQEVLVGLFFLGLSSSL